LCHFASLCTNSVNFKVHIAKSDNESDSYIESSIVTQNGGHGDTKQGRTPKIEAFGNVDPYLWMASKIDIH